RAALTLYQQRAERAQAEAERLARSRSLQSALERHDRRALRRILAHEPSVYVVGTGGLRAGALPRLAARLPVDVVEGARRLGEVVATVPLDVRLVERLRRGAAFDTGDVLVLLEGTRIVASAPLLHGDVAVAAGRSATVQVADSRYRALAGPALPEVPAARLAELEAERARGRQALARFGEALAATHDAEELLRIVAVEAAEATSARGCWILSADGSVVVSGDPNAQGERLSLPLSAAGEHFG